MSVEHVSVAVDVLAALAPTVDSATVPRAESYLVEQAGLHGPKGLAHLGRHLRHVPDPDRGRCPDPARLAADHPSYPVTTAIWRALVARDGGCAFAGCDGPPEWTEAHHRTHWEDGGETSVQNCCLLCDHHHRVVPHQGWAVELVDGVIHVVPPPWIDPGPDPAPKYPASRARRPRRLLAGVMSGEATATTRGGASSTRAVSPAARRAPGAADRQQPVVPGFRRPVDRRVTTRWLLSR